MKLDDKIPGFQNLRIESYIQLEDKREEMGMGKVKDLKTELELKLSSVVQYVSQKDLNDVR